MKWDKCRSALLAAIVLSACGTKYVPVAFEAPREALKKQSSFYVMLPSDGRYGGTTYENSGEMTAQIVAKALAVHAAQVWQAPFPQSLNAALASARQANYSHVFQSTILNWEDRATEWSGVKDKLSVRFEVYEVQTGKLVSSLVTDASSSIWTLGGDHPQDLLASPAQSFVDALF
jgi:hypothetical protein